ncbi:uncharacterized protein LOC128548723 [Mercenaria mercenaria]|uniref:uncharacterized protein LOC128548723 n=1 Tax=Mercenaria mercenaria TaxID=6596 RepID=UPI00234E7E04|nr:uncharacterized protein LOC128548723 [Mercenaria mercenaria]
MNNPQVRKKTVWEQITAEINETYETKFQASQVEGRWKTILSSYRKCKDAKKESGAARKDYEFEEELDDILMDSHTTQPAYTFSSGKGNDNSSKRKVEETVEGEEPQKLRTSGSDKVIHFLEGFIEKSERMEKERIEESKRMHNEKMGVFRELIEALNK